MFDYNSISHAFEEAFLDMKELFAANESDFVRIHGKEKNGSADVSVGMLDFERSHVEIVYIAGAPMYAEKSLLECRIYPDKRDTSLFFSPYELMYDVFGGARESWHFPYIESPERMKYCASYMMKALLPFIDEIDEIACDLPRCYEIYEKKRAALKEFFKNDEDYYDDSESSLEIFALKITYYDGWLSRLISTKAFSQLLEGENTLPLVRIMNDPANPDFFKKMYAENSTSSGMPFKTDEEADSLSACMKNHGAVKNLLFLCLATLVSFPALYLFYFIVYTLLVSVGFGDALFTSSVGSALLVSNLALISSILAAYFVKRPIIAIFSRNRKRRLAYHDMLFSGFAKKVSRLLLILSLLVSVVLIAFSACRNYAFYTDGFYDNSSFFEISGDYYSYEEISHVEINEKNALVYLEGGQTVKISSMHKGSREQKLFSELMTEKGIDVKEVQTEE